MKAAMMSIPFVQALDVEIAQLKAELANDPRLVKLRELERVRRLYAGEPDVAAPPELESRPKGTSRRSSPVRQQILDEAEAFLSLQPKPLGVLSPAPTPTARILEYVETVGLDVPGQNKRNSLSAMLSNSPRFRSHGRAGWTLAADETDSAQDTETADHDLDESGSAASAEPRPTSEGAEPVRPVNPWPGGGT